MSTRHAWIVYPLLFLALGAALRDKFIPPAQLRARTVVAEAVQARDLAATGHVRCAHLDAATVQCALAKVQGLTVAGPDGVERAALAAAPGQGAQLVLCGRDGKPVLLAGADEQGQTGLLEIVTADGRPQVRLGSVQGNGTVSTVDGGQDAVCILGSDGQSAGLFLELPKLKQSVTLRAAAVPKPAPKPGDGDNPPAPKGAP